MQIVKCRDLVDVPWKNGGGITRKIATGLHAKGSAWTLSRADVAQDGPFSNFAGMVRVLTVASGTALTLDTPEKVIVANPWTPLRFDGGLDVSARLEGGPLTNLNLMFDPTLCEGEVITRKGPLTQCMTPPARGLTAFHILLGAPKIGAVMLSGGDTTFHEEGDVEIALEAGDALLEVRLTYPNQSAAIRLCIAER